MDRLQLKIPPVVLVLIAAAMMVIIAYTLPGAMPVPFKAEIALLLALSGVWVALAGVQAFRRHKTTVNPLTPEQSSALVATGVYRISRNPMYLGFLLVLSGWAVFLAHALAALLLPLFILYMNRFQIQPEEQALTLRFGPAFRAYCQSVRRWL